LEKDFIDEPVVDGEKAFITSTAIDKKSEGGLGPSAFSGTEKPYLARLFEMGTQEILQLGLRDSLANVDTFILDLVKERKWTDTEDSYNRVLSELKNNLGIDPNLQPLLTLERLNRGVRLLSLQRMHRRRGEQIQKQLTKLK
jgi:hypothetical protein